MNYEVRRSTPSKTLEWVRDNQAVGELARASASVAGKAFPDAVLDDPSRLVDVVKTALLEAIRTDAPAGVAEELLPVLRFMSLGAAKFDRNSSVAKELSALQGLRDPTEIAAALARRTADTLDESSRLSIERMRRLAELQPASDELVTLAPDESSPAPTSPFVEPGETGVGATVDESGGPGTESGATGRRDRGGR